MIYMIEINYTDPASEAEWNAWYETYLEDLVTVPGIETAQRFRCSGRSPWPYLAVYTLTSTDVYEEPRYREVGGGGQASARWRKHIRRRRNLYTGVERVPTITASSVLLVTETPPDVLDLENTLFVSLDAVDMVSLARAEGSALAAQVPFDGQPSRRYIAVASAVRADQKLGDRNDLAVYRPSSGRLTAAGSKGRIDRVPA